MARWSEETLTRQFHWAGIFLPDENRMAIEKRLAGGQYAWAMDQEIKRILGGESPFERHRRVELAKIRRELEIAVRDRTRSSYPLQ